jgi:hypothetical protein
MEEKTKIKNLLIVKFIYFNIYSLKGSKIRENPYIINKLRNKNNHNQKQLQKTNKSNVIINQEKQNQL